MCHLVVAEFLLTLLQSFSFPGIEPAPLAMKAQNLNHWITRKFPSVSLLDNNGNISSYRAIKGVKYFIMY